MKKLFFILLFLFPLLLVIVPISAKKRSNKKFRIMERKKIKDQKKPISSLSFEEKLSKAKLELIKKGMELLDLYKKIKQSETEQEELIMYIARLLRQKEGSNHNMSFDEDVSFVKEEQKDEGDELVSSLEDAGMISSLKNSEIQLEN